MVAFVAKEGLPDPSEVRLALPVELDSGADSGVDEEVIAEAAGIGEAAQELDMLLRDGTPQGRERSLVGKAIRRGSRP